MITLKEALVAVKEKNLDKTQLEAYFDELSLLLAQLHEEAGELEKEEALFLADREQVESVISRKVSWKATQAGQRLIVVKRWISATKTVLGSIKNRIYAQL